MKIRIFGWLMIAAFAAMSGHSRAANLTTLVSFNDTNGSGPNSLIADAQGNLFGTTFEGGLVLPACSRFAGASLGCGTVFEIVNNGTVTAPSYANTPTTLAIFNGLDGAGPGGLIADTEGNLLGTTSQGGQHIA
jgi:hypothetical protein